MKVEMMAGLMAGSLARQMALLKVVSREKRKVEKKVDEWAVLLAPISADWMAVETVGD